MYTDATLALLQQSNIIFLGLYIIIPLCFKKHIYIQIYVYVYVYNYTLTKQQYIIRLIGTLHSTGPVYSCETVEAINA